MVFSDAITCLLPYNMCHLYSIYYMMTCRQNAFNTVNMRFFIFPYKSWISKDSRPVTVLHELFKANHTS